MADAKRPTLSIWALINMSVGFFGIQHGFEIQFARMSSIYEKLGAKPDQIPLLWLAAPATGLIIQPIIGYLSDKTWIAPLKMRRRPYFLAGAALASAALCLMPEASSLWMAAGLLWILDASLNVTMEPFRALVADTQNSEQRPTGYALQSLMIGLGTILGNYIASVDLNQTFPFLAGWGKDAAHLSFYACAGIFLASVIYSVVTTPEYPPEKPVDSAAHAPQKLWPSFKKWLLETKDCYFHMPSAMKRLAVIQFFTWMGLFCMWIYYSLAVAHNVFGAQDPHSALYDQGIRWAARTTMFKGLATPIFAACLPFLVRRLGRAYTHAAALLACGAGLLCVPWIHDPRMLYLPMIAAGVGWASIVSMPYVILVEQLPADKYGIFMGIFNMFIVIPEILVSVGLGSVISGVLRDNDAAVVALGGALILVASLMTLSLRRFEPAACPTDAHVPASVELSV